MRPAEIRKLSLDELMAKTSDLREELMKLRFQQVTGQLTDTSRLRQLRRDIARLETIQKEGSYSKAEEKAEKPAKEPKPKAKPRAKAKAKSEEKEGEE